MKGADRFPRARFLYIGWFCSAECSTQKAFPLAPLARLLYCWDVIMDQPVCHCDVCGHEWLKDGDVPKRCAKCKSCRWNFSERKPPAPPVVKPKPESAPPVET